MTSLNLGAAAATVAPPLQGREVSVEVQMPTARPLIDRLLEKTRRDPATGCLEFTGYRDPKGYGQIRDGERMSGAHRVMWEFAYGPIPDGLCILHRCDNPCCCEPEHLFLGTKADNNADMVSKGRQCRGERMAEVLRRGWDAMPPERRTERTRASRAAVSTERRAEIFRKMNALLTPGQRSERARRAAASKTPEQRREAALKGAAAYLAKTTPEQRSAVARRRAARGG